MYQVMMQQITSDRIKDARQQAEAHRQALQARAARQAETAGAVDKATFRQVSGIASRLLTAAKQAKLRLTFSPGEIS